MEDQPSLFEARADRDEALERVSRRTQALHAAYNAALAVRAVEQRFTTEHLRAHLVAHDPDGARAVDKEARVLGAAMMMLAREHLAAPTSEYVKTGRRSNHGRPQQVWMPLQSPPRLEE